METSSTSADLPHIVLDTAAEAFHTSGTRRDGRLFLAASAGNLWQQTALAFGVTLGLLGILPWWSDVLGWVAGPGIGVGLA